MKRGILLCVLPWVSLAADEGYQNAGKEDIELLYKTATSKPVNSHFIATITRTHAPWTESEIKLRMDDAAKVDGKGWTAEKEDDWRKLMRDQIAGQFIRRSEQWYTDEFERRDDVAGSAEVNAVMKRRSDKDITHVFLAKGVSRFTGYTIFWGMRSVRLTRDIRVLKSDDLWSVYGLDPELLQICLAATTDLSDSDIRQLVRSNYAGLRKVRSSTTKYNAIMGGQGGWMVQVRRDRTTHSRHFSLKGTVNLDGAAHPIEANLIFEESGLRPIFRSGDILYKESSKTFSFERSRFDNDSIATVTTRVERENNRNIASTTVEYITKSIAPELNPSLFAIPNGGDYSAFTISDVTNKKVTVVYEPASKARKSENDKKRVIVLGMLGLATCLMSWMVIVHIPK